MKKMADVIYVKGMRLFPVTDGAPDFVKGSGVITINELVKFCKDNPDYMSDYKGEAQLRFELLDGRNGLYFAVNTWKPNETNSTEDAETTGNNDKTEEDNSELPF